MLISTLAAALLGGGVASATTLLDRRASNTAETAADARDRAEIELRLREAQAVGTAALEAGAVTLSAATDEALAAPRSDLDTAMGLLREALVSGDAAEISAAIAKVSQASEALGSAQVELQEQQRVVAQAAEDARVAADAEAARVAAEAEAARVAAEAAFTIHGTFQLVLAGAGISCPSDIAEWYVVQALEEHDALEANATLSGPISVDDLGDEVIACSYDFSVPVAGDSAAYTLNLFQAKLGSLEDQGTFKTTALRAGDKPVLIAN